MSKSSGTRLVCAAAAFLMIVVGLQFGAGTAAAAESDFTYELSGSPEVATITGYVGPGGDVTIPATIAGYDVAAIGDTAFYANTNITTISISAGPASIGAYAFYACTAVTSIDVPASVTSIGTYAFSQCSALTTISVDPGSGSYLSSGGVLYDHAQLLLIQCPGARSGAFTVPVGVTEIGPSAFESCALITSMSIPASVTTIGDYAFSQCQALMSFTVSGTNPSFSSANGILYDKSGATLLKCPGGRSGSFSIPNGVTAIAANAFEYCALLTSVTIPDSVTDIGPSAFATCTSISSVNSGNGVQTIGEFAFYQCTSLDAISLPGTVTAIGTSAFDTCTAMTSATLGTGVTSIGSMAFFDCTSLTVVKFLGLTAPAVASEDWVAGTPGALRGRAQAASDFPPTWTVDGDPTFYGLKMGAYLSPPSAPLSLNAVPGNSQVSLSWSVPSDDGGSSVTGYRVYRATSEFGTYSLIASPASTSYTDTNLVNGQQYWYCVSAVNYFGEGSQCSSVSATPYTVPGAPSGLNADAGNAQVTLTWNAPTSDGGRAIDYYIVYQDGSALPARPVGTSITITGLSNGREYSFQVAAHNIAGTGTRSAAATATPYTVPGAPSGLAASEGNAQVTLTWNAPASDGGRAIDYYIVYQGGSALPTHFLGLQATITGLTNGQAYTFVVAAHNGAGMGSPSAPTEAVPFTVPGTVRNLNAPVGDGYALIQWDAPASDGGRPIDYYVIYQDGVDIDHRSIAEILVMGLNNGQPYVFAIAAHNSAGEGVSSEISATPYTSPDAPVLGQVNAGLDSLTLTWSAPAFDGGRPITMYKVYWDTADPPFSSWTFCSSTERSLEVTGLTAGTRYYLTVVAINSAGEGARPAALSGIPYTYPGAPTLDSAQPGLRMVTLAWTAPSETGYGPLTGYKVFYGTTPTPSILYATVGSSVLTADVSGLEAGTKYYFAVRSVNAAGDSPASNVIDEVPYSTPSAPTLSSAQAGYEQVILTWTAPAFDGGLALTGYRIFYGTGTVPDTLYGAVGATTLSATISGITPGIQYVFAVKASNLAGDSALSNVIAATPYTVPSAPILSSASAGYLQAALTWSAPASDGGMPITGYKVFYGSAGPTQQFGGILSAASRSINVTGLSAGTSYHFAVRAVNAAGDSADSNELTAMPYTMPQAPTLLTASGGQSKALLSWEAPDNTGFIALTGFKVFYGASSPDTQYGGLIGPGTTSIEVLGLTAGVNYSFAVKAVNAAGDGPLSNIMKAIPFTVPGAPELLTAEGGVEKVVLTWAPPSSSGFSEITGYKVFFGIEAPLAQFGGLLSPQARTIEVTGLQVAVEYRFAVRAVNAAGDSALSNELQASAYSIPGAPTLTSAAAGIGEAVVTWTAPSFIGGMPIQGYRVFYGTAAPDIALPGVIPATQFTAVISGLVNGTVYYFGVKAFNVAGDGPMSNVLNARPYTVPDAPQLLSAAGGLNSAELTWAPPLGYGWSPIVGYKVFYGLAEPNTQFGPILPSSARVVNVTELSAGVTYHFAVKAVNAAGDSNMSNALSAVVIGAPGAPTGLTASSSVGKVELTWQAPAADGGSPITGYKVYRAVSGSAVLLAQVGAGTLAFTDSNGTAGTIYTYYVMASNSVGTSVSSVPVSAAAQSSPTDNTMLIVVVAIMAIGAIAVAAYALRRK